MTQLAVGMPSAGIPTTEVVVVVVVAAAGRMWVRKRSAGTLLEHMLRPVMVLVQYRSADMSYVVFHNFVRDSVMTGTPRCARRVRESACFLD